MKKYNYKNKPIQCIQYDSTCYKNTTVGTPVGILFHSTGVNNPYIKRYVQPSDNDSKKNELLKLIGVNKNKNDWNHVSVQAGLNAWIGKIDNESITTVQTMPWNYRPWGCGSGKNGSCNGNKNIKNSPFWIQFEICEDGLSDKDYFNKAYNEAIELSAYLCERFNINPKGYVSYNGIKVPTILCHKDSYKLGLGSDHSDVYNWFPKFNKCNNKTMNDVIDDIANKMNDKDGSIIDKKFVVKSLTDISLYDIPNSPRISLDSIKKGTNIEVSKVTYDNKYGYCKYGWFELNKTSVIKEDEIDMTVEEVKKLITDATAVAIKEAKLAIDTETKKLIDDKVNSVIDERVNNILSGKDTKPSNWIVKSGELEAAKETGITDGTRPGGYAKREEVAAMVYRALSK